MSERIEPKATEKNPGKVAWLILTILLIVLAIFVVIFQDTQKLLAFLKPYGRWSALVCIFIYALLGATPVPSEPITLLLTTLFGPWWTALIATIENTLAALIEFFIGGRINDLSDFQNRKARLPFHLGELPIDSPAFLLIGRMLPGFGPKFVSVASGVYQVPIWTYTWTAFVSNTLGTLVVALGGYSLLQLL